MSGAVATQSSVGWGGDAELAIDGIFEPSGDYTASTCTATNGADSWWEVELPASYHIQTVQVLNRGDCCSDRLNGFNVYVDDVLCASNVQIGDAEDLMVDCSATGSRVKITADTSYLTLCEVTIFGEPQGMLLELKHQIGHVICVCVCSIVFAHMYHCFRGRRAA